MRFKLLFFSLMLAVFFGSIINSSAEPKKYYIYFDNFDDQQQIFNDSTTSNLLDLCYWNYISSSQLAPLYYKYAVKAHFNAATFAAKDITEYDIAVFPMGPKLGLDATIDGIKVMDKIQQMIDAGKSVFIIGNSVVSKAFAANGDPQVRTFLEEFLGIDYPITRQYVVDGKLQFVIGNLIYGCTIDGKEGDVVAEGFDIPCNQKYQQGGGDWVEPIRWHKDLDVFKIKDGSLAIPFHKVSIFANDSIKDKNDLMYTGVRNWSNTAKVALWTTDFDMAVNSQISVLDRTLINAFKWATDEIARPEQFIRSDNTQYDFKTVGIGNKGFQKITIQNFGREPLVISKIEIVESEHSSVFSIMEGGDPVTIEPNGFHTINVSFTPTDSIAYSEAIDIKSNAVNANTLSIELYGEGGNVNHGGYIQVTDLPVDFGTVAYGKFAEKNISIENLGDVGLVVNIVKLTEDANKYFAFPKVVKTPITIPQQEKYWLTVRFTSLDSNGGSYTGKLTLESDALNQSGPIDIVLKANGESSSIKSGIEISSTNIDFGNVNIGDSLESVLKITNKGTVDLVTQKPKLTGGGESVAMFSWVNNSNQVPVLKPGENWDLVLRFKPAAAKTYQASLKIISNDAVKGNIVVPVQGIGGTPGVVENDVTPGGLIQLEVKPNPVNESSVLNYIYNGTKISNLKIKMVDLNGKNVIDLFNDNINLGINSIQLNTKGLADGKYIIVAEFDGTISQLPVVIAK